MEATKLYSENIKVIHGENNINVTLISGKLSLKGDFQFELLKDMQGPFLEIENIKKIPSGIQQKCKIKPSCYSILNISKCTKVEKRLILLNIGKHLENSNRRYITWLSPENIYFNNQYEIYFGFRLLPEMLTKTPLTNELNNFKALVLSVFQSKYTYEQLCEIGIDVLDKETEFNPILEAKNFTELLEYLKNDYTQNYISAKRNVMAFSVKGIKIFSIAIMLIVAVLLSSFGYFSYQYLNNTRAFSLSKSMYQSHYNRNALAVKEYGDMLGDENLDTELKLVLADSLITIGEVEDLQRAFYLDESRQMECVINLMELEEFDIIAGLHSDKNKIQMYQAFCAKDYSRAIYIAETNLDLKYDAQAQVLLAQAHMNLGEYVRAEQIVDGLGDVQLQLDIYKKHREHVLKNETNIQLKSQLIDSLDMVIAALENTIRESYQ